MLKTVCRSPRGNSKYSLHSYFSGCYITEPCIVHSLVASRPRRHSSSKPSSSSNGDPTSIPASTNPSSKEVASGSRKRASSKTTKPRSKESVVKPGVSTPLLSLPSVPSTQHLHSQDITLASFFSLHRPISVVAPVPPTSTNKAFSAIFTPTFKPSTEEASFTIASAVSNSPLGTNNLHTADDVRPGVVHTSTLNGESPVTDSHHLYINMEELTKNFRPFNPPPPPEPVSTMNNHSAYKFMDRRAMSVQDTMANRMNQTTIIIHRDAPIGFSKRRRMRQTRWKARRVPLHRLVYKAISVRRQRKLKMKKHKYKKLMKRTRNLRRKLDRL